MNEILDKLEQVELRVSVGRSYLPTLIFDVLILTSYTFIVFMLGIELKFLFFGLLPVIHFAYVYFMKDNEHYLNKTVFIKIDKNGIYDYRDDGDNPEFIGWGSVRSISHDFLVYTTFGKTARIPIKGWDIPPNVIRKRTRYIIDNNNYDIHTDW
ncbi:MAG: hypothetical protein GWO07_02225 [Candidatus Dadabacteria bacterium]|nr:hypothetical protein [Candidatus Dadabacteria bacterium]NIS07585.1 hypothetical protein [Candidatus Dadabacteria bacterium]NIY21219.1 hypothetical protein [Candidatus Dadabacteria bacterium]